MVQTMVKIMLMKDQVKKVWEMTNLRTQYLDQREQGTHYQVK